MDWKQQTTAEKLRTLRGEEINHASSEGKKLAISPISGKKKIILLTEFINLIKGMTDAEKLSVLIEDYKITSGRIEDFIKSQGAFNFWGFTFIFGMLGFIGAETSSPEIFLILPSVMIIYAGLFLYHYQRCLVNQVYKDYLEGEINKLFSKKLIFYTELGYRKFEKNNFVVSFIVLSYLLIILAAIITFFIYFGKSTHGVDVLFIYISAFVTILLLIFFLYCIYRIVQSVKYLDNNIMPEIIGKTHKD